MLKFYYILIVKGSRENDQKGPKINDANFLKFILGNSGDNKEKYMFAQERSFYNFLRYNQNTNRLHYKSLLTL